MELNSQNPEQAKQPNQPKAVDFRRKAEVMKGQPEPLAPVEATPSTEAPSAPAPVTPSATVDLSQALLSAPSDTEATNAAPARQVPEVTFKGGQVDGSGLESIIGGGEESSQS